MKRRKGVGKGLGQGFKNLLPQDTLIHGLSAKGVKTVPLFRSNPVFKKVSYKDIDPVSDAIAVFQGKTYGTKEDLKFMPEMVSLVELNAKGKSKLEKDMLSKFSQEQLDVLEGMNTSVILQGEGKGLWSIPFTKKRGDPSKDEIAFVMNQLDISRPKAEKLVKSYLDTLDKYPVDDGFKFVGLEAKGKLPFKTMDDFIDFQKAKGFHFFDRDTKKYFNSLIHTRGALLKGKYFITSEKFTSYRPSGEYYEEPRKYTVRKAKEDGSVDTIGEFQQFKTLSEAKKYVESLK